MRIIAGKMGEGVSDMMEDGWGYGLVILVFLGFLGVLFINFVLVCSSFSAAFFCSFFVFCVYYCCSC